MRKMDVQLLNTGNFFILLLLLCLELYMLHIQYLNELILLSLLTNFTIVNVIIDVYYTISFF